MDKIIQPNNITLLLWEIKHEVLDTYLPSNASICVMNQPEIKINNHITKW